MKRSPDDKLPLGPEPVQKLGWLYCIITEIRQIGKICLLFWKVLKMVSDHVFFLTFINALPVSKTK